jgi:hypothetical protein
MNMRLIPIIIILITTIFKYTNTKCETTAIWRPNLSPTYIYTQTWTSNLKSRKSRTDYLFYDYLNYYSIAQRVPHWLFGIFGFRKSSSCTLLISSYTNVCHYVSIALIYPHWLLNIYWFLLAPIKIYLFWQFSVLIFKCVNNFVIFWYGVDWQF